MYPFKPKISIITPTFNVEKTLQDTLNSVVSQTYTNIEHIIVDGCSSDKTIELLNLYDNKNAIILSEKDKGLYDAINKGINLASGEIIGILNADDIFFDNEVIANIVDSFNLDADLQAIYGNIVFVNKSNKVIRKYNANRWNSDKFRWGFMPPHPSFFCKKLVFQKFGYYEIDYKISADFELLIRFIFTNRINVRYVPITTTIMRMGGVSTKGIRSVIILNREILKACKKNSIYTNYLMLYSKYFKKVFEFV